MMVTETETESETDWAAVARMNPTVRAMIEAGTPLTRANYIDVKWGAPGTMDHPEEWTIEHEMDIPAGFEGT
jgi:hypothetical protein